MAGLLNVALIATTGLGLIQRCIGATKGRTFNIIGKHQRAADADGGDLLAVANDLVAGIVSILIID